MANIIINALKELGIVIPEEYAGLVLPVVVGLVTLLVTILFFSNVSPESTGSKKRVRRSKSTGEVGTKVVDGVRRSTRTPKAPVKLTDEFIAPTPVRQSRTPAKKTKKSSEESGTVTPRKRSVSRTSRAQASSPVKTPATKKSGSTTPRGRTPRTKKE